MNNIPSSFECKFCYKHFVRESSYLKHKCKQMQRKEEIQTPIGQAAWSLYQDWMTAYHRMAPSPDIFLTSKYYSSFIRFAKYVKELNIPGVDLFLSLMKERDISPTIWTHDDVYALYLEYLDRQVSPIKQAEITINTLFKLSDKCQCDIAEVFNKNHPNETLQLIRARQLSPWLLMHSVAFKKLMIRCSPETRSLFEALIRPQYWKYKFDKNPEIGKIMKKYADEMGI